MTEQPGDADFHGWVSPHLPVMARVAARFASAPDRDDVVQDALTRAWTRRATFDATRGTPAGWLCAIVAGEARRRRDRAHPPTVPLPDIFPAAAAAAADPARDLDLEAAVAKLSGRQREAVDLHYFAGLTVAETATAMSCAPGTVKSTLSDARARLRTLLEQP